MNCPAGFDPALLSGPFAQPCPVGEAGVHFTTPPLESATEITGHPVASLWVSADATDVNLFVYLEDVDPAGGITAISDGRQRASLRKLAAPPWEFMGLPWRRSDRADEEPLIPGEPVRVALDLLPVSYVFKAGHRIRVTVTGADYRERNRQAADPAPHVTIRDSKEQPSVVELPVMPQNPADAAP